MMDLIPGQLTKSRVFKLIYLLAGELPVKEGDGGELSRGPTVVPSSGTTPLTRVSDCPHREMPTKTLTFCPHRLKRGGTPQKNRPILEKL